MTVHPVPATAMLSSPTGILPVIVIDPGVVTGPAAALSHTSATY